MIKNGKTKKKRINNNETKIGKVKGEAIYVQCLSKFFKKICEKIHTLFVLLATSVYLTKQLKVLEILIMTMVLYVI